MPISDNLLLLAGGVFVADRAGIINLSGGGSDKSGGKTVNIQLPGKAGNASNATGQISGMLSGIQQQLADQQISSQLQRRSLQNQQIFNRVQSQNSMLQNEIERLKNQAKNSPVGGATKVIKVPGSRNIDIPGIPSPNGGGDNTNNPPNRNRGTNMYSKAERGNINKPVNPLRFFMESARGTGQAAGSLKDSGGKAVNDIIDFGQTGASGYKMLATGRATTPAGKTYSFDPLHLGKNKGPLWKGPDPFHLGPNAGPIFGGKMDKHNQNNVDHHNSVTKKKKKKRVRNDGTMPGGGGGSAGYGALGTFE